MASGIGLNTGLRALLSSRLVLDTIGHNVANANTPGYSRQIVDLGATRSVLSRGLLVGNGVDATSVRRTVDALLQRRLLVQSSVQGNLESRLTGLAEVEALLSEPDGASLGARLDGFFGSLASLSTNPTDGILRTGLVNSAQELGAQFNGLAQSLAGIRRDAAREIELRVDDVNRLATEISGLNQEILAAESLGLAANDLLDRRDLLVSQLAQHVDLAAVEESNGSLRVLVAGHTLVSSSRAHALRAHTAADGSVTLRIEGSAGEVSPTGGTLGGLAALAQSSVPELEQKLDLLAANLVRAINRVHATGVPASGSYGALRGVNALADVDHDGNLRDELLSNSGLPFPVENGALFVNVIDEADGSLAKHRIDVSRTHTTVGDFLDALNAIPELSAGIDSTGRLQIDADTGFRFDFSRRLDPDPDQLGSFGGAQASLASAAAGPFALADGDVLALDVGGTPVSIAFASSDFAQIGQATADEIAAVIRADAGAQANGITASAVGGRLVLQSTGTGSAVSFTLTGGSATGALGWSGLTGANIAGHDAAVAVAITGQYAGAENELYTFVAQQDGVVGTTAGLTVDVLDAEGVLVASLDVGAGYVPGTPLEVAHGISVAFGLGELSATHNDTFALDALAESDTAGLLAATGLGAFFSGTTAADIALAPDIALDPSLLASSLSGAAGDNQILLELADVANLELDGLQRASLGEFYGELVGAVGFDAASTADSLAANDALMQSLEQRSQELSGVNVDEELVRLLEFEQAFAAASRYISVLNELNDDLLGLL